MRDLKDAVFSGIRMPCPESGDMDKEAYRTAFEEIMRRIDSGVLEKVVLSRTLIFKRGRFRILRRFFLLGVAPEGLSPCFRFSLFYSGKGSMGGSESGTPVGLYERTCKDDGFGRNQTRI